MQRVLAGLMIPLVLLQAMHLSFRDLVQLDEFVQHAQFHQQQYGDSFLVFVSKHYGELKSEHEQNNQEERPDHEQLPFQISTIGGSAVAIAVTRSTMDFGYTEFSESNAINAHYLSSTSDSFDRGVFQPPQIA